MARTICIMLLACVLGACSSMGAQLGLLRSDPASPPRPLEGLWAILDPGCDKPEWADTRSWPRCASPFWINHSSAFVINSNLGANGKGPSTSYRADLKITPGSPLILRAGTPRDGYIYLALAKLEHDKKGHMIGATGSPFGCRAQAQGPISLKPTTGGCELASIEEMRRAGEVALSDEATLSRIVWIAPGAP